MYVAICEHIKLGGGRCGSPALRGEHFCYFHAGAHRAIPSLNLWPSTKAPRRLLPAIVSPRKHREHGISHHEALCHDTSRLAFVDHGLGEDSCGSQHQPQRTDWNEKAAAIQLGFTRLIWGITQGLLNVRQGKLILGALHKAAAEDRERTATGASAVASNELPFAIDSSLAVSGIQGD